MSIAALLASAGIDRFPASSVAVPETFLFFFLMLRGPPRSALFPYPALFRATTAAGPANWLKSTVTLARSALLSPAAALFQVAVTVSPTLKAPPVPLAPLRQIGRAECRGRG